MQAYNKAIVAVVGGIVMVAQKHLGIDLTGTEAIWIDIIVAVLTAAGVYGLPNQPKEIT